MSPDRPESGASTGPAAEASSNAPALQHLGHPRLRARHLPYAIGIAERDQSMGCMMRAMRERELPEPLAHRLAESLFSTADRMRNR